MCCPSILCFKRMQNLPPLYLYTEGSRMSENVSCRNAIIVDTSVLIHDPDSVEVLLNGGDNTVFIPWLVISELDKLQSKPDIGIDARQAIENIQALRNKEGGKRSVQLVQEVGLDKIRLFSHSTRPEHHALALVKMLASETSKRKEFDKVKLVSRNAVLRLLASDLGDDLEIEVDDYHRHQAKDLKERELKNITVSWADIDLDSLSFDYLPDIHGEINENEGVVCHGDQIFPGLSEESTKPSVFAAIRKSSVMHVVPRDINCMGLVPLSNNGEPNWWQYIAMYQLMDPSIHMVFLRGGAGTGKTLLAMAAGVERRSRFNVMVVARPMVHLEDQDNMGYLPGSVEEKMSPWMAPIHHALSIVKEVKRPRHDNRKIVNEMEKTNKIILESLDYIRGITYHRTFMVVDEAQNLTPHQIKTIVTRAGSGTKLVFTGDLDQIDRRGSLDKRSSGLAYAIENTVGDPMVGVTTFNQTVRSPLAGLGERLL